MLTPVKNHQGCGHYILKWFVTIFGPAQCSKPGILRKFNQYQLLWTNIFVLLHFLDFQGAADFQNGKGWKAVKWERSRKAGVGREAKLLSCCGWVAGAGGRQGSADISGPGSRKAPTHPRSDEDQSKATATCWPYRILLSSGGFPDVCHRAAGWALQEHLSKVWLPSCVDLMPSGSNTVHYIEWEIMDVGGLAPGALLSIN